MFKKFQLKNGMKVLLVESHKSPVLSIQMWVKTGSADERKGEEGISHFIEHLVFKGSQKYKVGEIAAAVEGAGGELNAYTSFDQTVFYVTISKEYQSVGLDVISEMMCAPGFDEREIDNEREVVIEEIKRSNDSPHRQASRLLFSSVYKKHPYGIPVIGYQENISTVTRKTLVDYFQGRYNPKNMTLIVAGDFRSSEMRKQIEGHFNNFKAGKLRVVRRAAVNAVKKPALIVEKAPFAETVVHIAFPAPKASHKDTAALEVLALILGQGDSSRLNSRLRVNEHLVNFAGSSVFVARDPGFLAFSMSLNEKDLEAALNSLQDEILKAVQEPPKPQELRKATTNLASEQFYHMETVDGLARNLGHYQDLFNDPEYFKKFLKQVSKLTPADILRTARKYLDPQKMTFVAMTPVDRERIEPIAKKWTETLKKKIKSAKPRSVKAPSKKGKKISFVYGKPPKKQNQLEVTQLSNGVRLITFSNFDTPVVSVRCASLGGSRLESQSNQGATELLSRVWTAGCGPYSEAEVSHKIDEMAAHMTAFGGRNSVGLSMSSLRVFAPEMIELMGHCLREPHFAETSIQREIKAMQEHVKLRADNPAQLCILQFVKNLFGDHPYGRDPYGSEEGIGQLSQKNVKEMFDARLGLTFVAAGAMESSELKDRLEQAIGQQKVKDGQLKMLPLDYPAQEQRSFLVSQKQQSHLVMGFPGLKLTDERRFVLQVMQAILAGQGGRLFVELRDKASLAYSVSPLRMEGLEGGYFGAYIGCSPEKSGTALKMINEEFNKLGDKLVSEQELERAHRYLIGKHAIELQRNSNLTSSILFDEIYGIDHQETFRFTDRIRAVTRDSIQEIAQQLFSKPPVISLVGPSAPWA